MDEKDNNQAKKGGNPSRDILYAEAAKHAPRAIAVLVEIMEKGDNDNARMAAAKAILNKAIPDLKAMELSGKDGEQLSVLVKLDMAGGYIPSMGSIVATSTAGYQRSTQVQDTGVAQESEKDDNSSNGNSQTGDL